MRWPLGIRDRLGIDLPIVLAPMAGGISTPELVAAVSNAGGLGSFGGGYLSGDALREAIRRIRALTSRPFAVNLFAPEPPRDPPPPDDLARAARALAPWRAELGLPPRSAPEPLAPHAERMRAVLEEGVPVFSFTFGTLPPEELAALHRTGTFVMGTATTVGEARALEASGVDAVVAQGAEAGAHRGTFLGPPERGLVGTLALVPQLVDALSVPVVAAGGIMDGRGIAAALALGARAAALGTAFLACPESGASRPYKEALLGLAPDDDGTALTRAFTGRAARGLRNRFLEEMAEAPVLPYPLQHAMTVDLRREAAKAGKPELLSLWAGQGAPLARALPAAALVRELARETEAALAGLVHDE
jgi:nitronate monooxygenase